MSLFHHLRAQDRDPSLASGCSDCVCSSTGLCSVRKKREQSAGHRNAWSALCKKKVWDCESRRLSTLSVAYLLGGSSGSWWHLCMTFCKQVPESYDCAQRQLEAGRLLSDPSNCLLLPVFPEVSGPTLLSPDWYQLHRTDLSDILGWVLSWCTLAWNRQKVDHVCL